VALLEESLKPVPTELNPLDWKRELSPKNDRLVEHLCAMANLAGGGFLVFGIDNVTAQPVGMTPEVTQAILGRLTNLGRDGVEPPIALDHGVVDWEAKPLLVVHIPEQPSKPVHRRGQSIESTWVRSGGTTRKASRQEVGEMLMTSRSPRWEQLRASTVITTAETLDQLDVAGICKLLGRPVPPTPAEVLRWLVDENMVQLDGDHAYITNFGAMAAARDLRQFASLDRKRVRLIRYRGLNKVETIDEIVGQKGYAIGFEGLISHLKRALPHSEVIREALRVEVSVFPEIALRELIANALIHQDFTMTGAGPMIEVFDDRIEFTSPGGLLPGKSVDRLIGSTPESRNEILAAAFRRYRICEERGTGFQKIVAAVELYGLPPVAFVAAENSFKVTLYAPRTFTDMSPKERIEACYQHSVLKFLSSSAMTNRTLRERLKMNDKQRNQVTNLIADAVNAGRIKRSDPEAGKKFAEYVPYWA
jgi:predicted HTH transcriptional regulator